MWNSARRSCIDCSTMASSCDVKYLIPPRRHSTHIIYAFRWAFSPHVSPFATYPPFQLDQLSG